MLMLVVASSYFVLKLDFEGSELFQATLNHKATTVETFLELCFERTRF